MRRLAAMCALFVLAAPQVRAQEVPAPPQSFPEGEVISLPLIAAAPPGPRRWWIQADYFLGWIQSDRTPGPLITTGSPNDPRPGALGNPNTRTLFDGTLLDYGLHSGLWAGFGSWFDDDQLLGFEVVGFMLETHTIHGEANSDKAGNPLIARPFFNTFLGVEDAMVITTPLVGAEGEDRFGGIDIFADSRTWGAQANLLAGIGSIGPVQIGMLGGFRYLGQKDELRFSQSSTLLSVPLNLGFLGNNVFPPDILSLKDFFETNNHFYGGQIGVRTEYRAGPWFFNLASSVALGSTYQKLHHEGWTMMTDSKGVNLRAPGGLYVVGANLGNFERWQFSVATEVSLKVGFQITQRLRTQFGYQFLYWDNVVRPGEQIDRNIDVRQVPSQLAYVPGFVGTNPQLLFGSTDFWLQGLTLGLTFQF